MEIFLKPQHLLVADLAKPALKTTEQDKAQKAKKS
jgi:hypothetical protein